MTHSTMCEIREDDIRYPSLLKNSKHYPKLLYYRGELPSESQPRIAIVGTRLMSVYGQRVVEMLVPPLVRAGYATVSGLAYGIDTCVHKVTLEADGVTHAVLGCGINDENIYPLQNRPLAHAIIDHGGCMLSEFAPFTSPRREFFPMRNRIVAGMCKGVIVIEAPEKSGALITAFIALDENREVFAVPGPITHRNTKGTHMLLRLGAHVVTCAEDVLRVFGDDIESQKTFSRSQRHAINLLPEEEKILACFGEDPVHIDTIAEQSCLDIRTINSTLGIMELKGFVKNVGQMKYVRA
ncbi:MAG: DNA-processing protein DprA [Candidatus Uhrbacteria bacterium]|nr:DNA-processing protein DprA [Candidatus Uhrbacteria bacterium]